MNYVPPLLLSFGISLMGAVLLIEGDQLFLAGIAGALIGNGFGLYVSQYLER